jgi:hypothetical protein
VLVIYILILSIYSHVIYKRLPFITMDPASLSSK